MIDLFELMLKPEYTIFFKQCMSDDDVSLVVNQIGLTRRDMALSIRETPVHVCSMPCLSVQFIFLCFVFLSFPSILRFI